ncbi:MAG TPA: glycosyltransferase family 2 protein [Polyangiales bacterium]|nr:glycosyltransferase family 2 protein [Polyangiales bacterium]
MWRDVTIAVVVPAYNEAKHIAGTLRGIPSFVDSIVVVDDGSRDDTAGEVHRGGDPRITLLRHAANRGVGQALSTGYTHAFQQGADIVAVMAGDGQMHPDDLERLLAPLVEGAADYAKGDRLSHPEVFRRMPLARLLGNHVLSLGTRVATGLSIRDSQCGYTALHRRAAERLPWSKLWRGYGYPNHLLGLLSQTGARVRDIVVRPVYADEESGIGWRHALLVIPFVLLSVALRRMLAAVRVSDGLLGFQPRLPPGEP